MEAEGSCCSTGGAPLTPKTIQIQRGLCQYQRQWVAADEQPLNSTSNFISHGPTIIDDCGSELQRIRQTGIYKVIVIVGDNEYALLDKHNNNQQTIQSRAMTKITRGTKRQQASSR